VARLLKQTNPNSEIVIYPGVGHGFFSADASVVMYGVSRYWDPDDELACNWADPELGIEWPAATALVSDRDRDAQPLQALLAQLEPSQPL